MSETRSLRYADYWRLPYENWDEDSWMNYLQNNYPDVSPRLARTYFIAELKVLINNLKPDSRELEKASALKSRIELVTSVGKDFEFRGRDNTFKILWEGKNDLNGIKGRFENINNNNKNAHPIPVLAGGPGTGKSRFLDELERLTKEHVNKDEKSRKIFENMTFLNVTYGNESPPTSLDIQVGCEASLAFRILFEYFRPKGSSFGEFINNCKNSNNKDIDNLTLDRALNIIYIDFTEQVIQNSSVEKQKILILIVGIDEFNKLYEINENLTDLVTCIGGIMCKPPAGIFFAPVLSGTIKGPIDDYIKSSLCKRLRLPLPLLENDDTIEIFGKAIRNEEYVRRNHRFRLCICDIGGHVKTLEYFYQFFIDRLEQLGNGNPHQVQVSEVIQSVKHKIIFSYNLKQYAIYLESTLAKAILGLPIRKNEKVNEQCNESYEDLDHAGILKLIQCKKEHYQIRIPYVLVCLLVKQSRSNDLVFWNEMLIYEETMWWQSFEEFNARFWALRLHLFRLAGYSKITLKELLKGAEFSRGLPDIEITLPETTIRLCRLNHRFPKKDDAPELWQLEQDEDMNVTQNDFINVEHLDEQYIEKYINSVFINGPGAMFDVFSIHQLNNLNNINKTLFVVQQIKKTNPQAKNPMIINNDRFNLEFNKVSEAMKNISTDEWVFLFLTDASAKDLTIKCKNNSAFVGKEQFESFFGYTYSSRAQFACEPSEIHVSSAPIEILNKYLGLDKKQCKILSVKRAHNKICNLEEMREMMGIGRNSKRFKVLKEFDKQKRLIYDI
ncbi:hypothetical protein RclHR1_02310002 [Rhizophagus clarus]|uniref:Crinkler effector protein N-terminal domain-containing protein n=1 Tax=Rhizophagus clarus TaxID=94130 RepID=A0A2Z6RPL8_9GLOM|nr:hypothetical protein RclHR1_02310002 [Rhizophagus clarus]